MTMAWPRAVIRWRTMLVAFKQDRSNPNPFEEPDVGELAWMRLCAHKLTICRWRVDQAEGPARQRRPGAAEGRGHLSSRYIALRIPPVRTEG